MERVSLIIKKLQQLLNDNASADVMLAISQMLVAELQQLQEGDSNLGGISVIVPKKSLYVEEVATPVEAIAIKEEVLIDEKPIVFEESVIIKEETVLEIEEEPIKVEETILEIVEEPIVEEETLLNVEEEPKIVSESTFEIEEPTEVTSILDVPIEEEPIIEEPVEEFILETPEEVHEYPEVAPVAEEKPLENTPNEFLYHTNIHTLPTLTQVDDSKTELNERLAKEEKELNSVLSENKVEVAHLHENTHIKDLKRAISINEKYLFINNLFGRNEDLYDKSIKHIQNFSILPEATFWIQKELKTKLQWSDEDEVVQLFDQFVKRRFS